MLVDCTAILVVTFIVLLLSREFVNDQPVNRTRAGPAVVGFNGIVRAFQ